MRARSGKSGSCGSIWHGRLRRRAHRPDPARSHHLLGNADEGARRRRLAACRARRRQRPLRRASAIGGPLLGLWALADSMSIRPPARRGRCERDFDRAGRRSMTRSGLGPKTAATPICLHLAVAGRRPQRMFEARVAASSRPPRGRTLRHDPIFVPAGREQTSRIDPARAAISHRADAFRSCRYASVTEAFDAADDG